MTARFASLAVCAALWFTPAAPAQIVGFNFANPTIQPGNEGSVTATTSDPFLQSAPVVSRGNIGTGAALTPTALTVNGGTGGSINSSGWNSTGNTFDATNGSYYTFTLTPTAGNQVVINSVNVFMTNGNKGPQNIRLYVSDGTTTNTTADWASGFGNTNAPHTFTISGGFTAAVGAAVEVRLYGYNIKGSSTDSTNTLAFVSNTSTVNGIAVFGSVPEAQTYVLAGLGLGLVGLAYAQKNWNRRRLAASAVI
jgi:hypothetical protein